MKLKKAELVFLPIFVFILVISVNLFKPFGFFRESNPAMVCINYNIWKQNPFLEQHRIPVQTYTFDPAAKPASQMWDTVASFGYGWFLIPYAFFNLFHLPAGEIPIRIFSLFWLAFTLFTAYLLCKALTRNMPEGRVVTYLTLVFYLFNASVLWYQVQGYVHETAVLPFYFLGWLFFIKIIQSNSLKWLIALALCLFIAVQFDWLPCFQAFVMSVHLFIVRKKLQSNLAFIVPAISIALGIVWIIYTYSNWATFPIYAAFLKEKFLSRTIGKGGLQLVPGLNYNFNIILFYLSGYGLLCLLFLGGLIKTSTSKVLWLIIISAILHHIVFWGFSTEHDHGVIKMAFPVAFIAASILSKIQFTKQLAVTCLVLMVNIGIYFFLHNYYTRKGMYANPNFCYEVGKVIREKFKEKNQYVFINTQGKYLLPIEFYAGKSYTLATTEEEAQEIFHKEHQNGIGYFIDGEKEGIAKIIAFK